ncbi:flavoprotein [Paenibacillus sp. FSL W7-1287]|uniref:flavoprotein n=1 Tax=Paenibacillus sp. FSL W7-1287 TaxID=2954538 RepID=UPI0030F9D52A
MNVNNEKSNFHILIGACGAISVVHLCSWINFISTSLSANITVILTKQAQRMVQPTSVTQFTHNPTYTDFFFDDVVAPHVTLPARSDLFLILPASANILGKAANGIADDLLSTAIINSNCPTVFVPFMNLEMWNKKSVQRNVKQLKDDGYYIYHERQINLKVSTGEQVESIGYDLSKLIIKLKRIISETVS